MDGEFASNEAELRAAGVSLPEAEQPTAAELTQPASSPEQPQDRPPEAAYHDFFSPLVHRLASGSEAPYDSARRAWSEIKAEFSPPEKMRAMFDYLQKEADPQRPLNFYTKEAGRLREELAERLSQDVLRRNPEQRFAPWEAKPGDEPQVAGAKRAAVGGVDAALRALGDAGAAMRTAKRFGESRSEAHDRQEHARQRQEQILSQAAKRPTTAADDSGRLSGGPASGRVLPVNSRRHLA